MRISQKAKNLKSLDLEAIFLEIVQQDQQQLLSLNKSQLQKGLTARGQKITPSYQSDRYARKKSQMNSKPGFGTPDLKLTGEFYSDFVLPEQSGTFQFASDDPKTGFLIDRYSREIFGLTPENKRKYINEEFRGKFIRKVKAQI